MDQGWKRIPLLVILLFFSNAYGFKGGPYSNAHRQWGQSSDNLSPRAVQSSVSEVPVTGTLPEEVGSSLFTDRPLKRLNLLQFVKGQDSSRTESTSNAQTAQSSSHFASLPLSLSKKHAGSLTSLQGSSGTTITDTANVSTPGESTSFPAILGTSGQSTSDQSSPSLYLSSSQEISGVKFAEANLPAFSQSISSSSSSAPGDTGARGSASTSQGSSGPKLSGSSRQFMPTQAGGIYGASQSLSTSSQYAPGSLMYRKFVLPIGVSSKSPNTQSMSTSTHSRSGSPLTSSVLFPVQEGSSSISRLSLTPQGTMGLYAPASPTKYASVPISHPAVYSQATRSSGAQFGASTGVASQGMGSTYSGSVQPQGTTSQFAPGSLSLSVSQFLPQGAASQFSTVQSLRKQFSSTFTGSSGTQSRSSMLLAPAGKCHCGGSLQPQGTTSRFAPGSPSSYPSVSLSSPQGAASQSATVQSSKKQVASAFTGSSGTLSGSSMPLSLQGIAMYGGSLQPQATTSRFAPWSPSSYPSVSLSSPQGAASQSATVQSSKQVASAFTGSSGTLSGSSMPLGLQGIAMYGGSLQPQATTSRFAPGSPSSYPSVSSPQGAATVQSSQKQVTASSATLSGTSMPLALQGIATYGGSLQPQDATSQFAPGSPSSYPSVSLSSPQGAATVQSSQKFSYISGTKSGSSMPLTLQGSTTYGGSLQPQGTTSQFAPGSPSSHPSVSLSSPQGAASQSDTVQSSQKQVTSTFTGSSGTLSGSSMPLSLQGIVTYGGSLQPQATTSQFAPGSRSSYPRVSSPQGAGRQSATVQSSQKQVASTFTGSSGTLSGSSMPLSLQGIATYGGSPKPQGTTNRFAPGSPSSYPNVSPSSPQGALRQSATVQSSQKRVTASSATLSGTSMPLSLQGIASYGASLQPQGTTSQFAPGSWSSYQSVLSSPQGATRQSATVQSSQKQVASTFTGSSGTLSGTSMPLTLQGSTTYGGSLQPQGTTSQSAPGSPYPSVLSSHQGVASQSSQALQSYSVSQSLKSQRWQPSQGIQTSGAAASVGSSLSQSSRMQSRFSSQSSAGGPSSRDSGPFVSGQGGSTSYGGTSLLSQSRFNKHTPGSQAYAKFGPLPLAVSSQSTSDQHSNGLYSSDSLQTQGLLGVFERPSSQAPSLTLQRPTGSNLAHSLGPSAQTSSVSMLSGIPQTAQASSESGSDVQLNKVSSSSQANAYTSLQKFSSNYGAQSLKPSELLRYQPGVYGQGTSNGSASRFLSSYGSMNNQNAPASTPSHISLSSRYSVKG